MNNNVVSPMLNALLEKHNALSDIYELTLSQPTLIENDDAEILLSHIDQRQVLIEKINDIDKRIAQMQKDSPAGSRELEKAQKGINELLEKIITQDKTNMKLAASKLEEYKQAAITNNNKKKEIETYMKFGYEESYYFDEKK